MDDLTSRLHDVGFLGLSGEEQDALIERGWHPGPNGGCGRRIGGLFRSVTYCGTGGLCVRCWSIRNPPPTDARIDFAAEEE